MKNQSMKLMLLGCLFAVSAAYGDVVANVAGNWTGTILPVGSIDPQQACGVSISITQSETELNVLSGELNCPAFQQTLSPERFQIRNGLLIGADGARHGTVDYLSVKFDLRFRSLEFRFLPNGPLARTYMLVQGSSFTGRAVNHEGFLAR